MPLNERDVTAAAASSDAVAGEEKLAAAPVAASDSDDASYDVRLGMEMAAGEEKLGSERSIEASAGSSDDDSFASARSPGERDAAEVMAAFSGEEDYFASVYSSEADASERKSEGRIIDAYSSGEDDFDECVSLPCEHGGLCQDSISSNNSLPLDNYTCSCAVGFAGYNCLEDIDECAPLSNCRS